MTAHTAAREQLCRVGASLFSRGLTAGSSGNLSVRVDDGFLVTPTNSCLGELEPARIAQLGFDGRLMCGAAPSKEWFFHRACYEARESIGAIVHLHSTHAAAVSCLANLDHTDCLPPLTAYKVMRVGRLPLIPYFRPGDPSLGPAVAQLIRGHSAVLLANHGPVVVGRSLEAARDAAEELEESAKLFFLLEGRQTRTLTQEQVSDLQRHFPGAPS